MSHTTMAYWMGVFQRWVYDSNLIPPQMEEAIIAVDEIVKMIKEDHEAQEKNTR